MVTVTWQCDECHQEVAIQYTASWIGGYIPPHNWEVYQPYGDLCADCAAIARQGIDAALKERREAIGATA